MTDIANDVGTDIGLEHVFSDDGRVKTLLGLRPERAVEYRVHRVR